MERMRKKKATTEGGRGGEICVTELFRCARELEGIMERKENEKGKVSHPPPPCMRKGAMEKGSEGGG